MTAIVWRLRGYRGESDYDNTEDNNYDFQMIMDARFSQKAVEKIMSDYWSKFYRVVVVEAIPIRTIEIE